MTTQLHALVWHALDTHPTARDSVAARLGLPPSSARLLVGDEDQRVRVALESIAASETARSEYQRGFTRLNIERVRRPSPAHDALAELLRRGTIEAVVSLNWDTLLETAYQRRYGVTLTPEGPLLYKPHGDAAQPNSKWVLPHEAGRIPREIEVRMAALVADRPRVLVVVGYSERDEEVARALIGPLAERWRVIRVTPSARGEQDVPLAAEKALPALLRAIHPSNELPGWEHVRFDNQHDLGPVLLGRKLGPGDVQACPRLPEVNDVLRLLEVGHSAVIVGGPGNGKSITSYQAAYDMALQGCEVLRPSDPRNLTQEMVNALDQLRHPAVVIVDDAHLADERELRRLLDSASQRLAVIAASTVDGSESGTSVRIGGGRAVEVITRELRKRRTETLAIVRRLDNRVGDGYLDEPFEDRLEEAARSETPWQFAFVLTGGWRRATSEVAALRDMDRADLLLSVVAIGQYLSLDAGAPLWWLQHATEGLGRDAEWLDRTLQALRDRRLVVGTGAVRLPHFNYAKVALRIACENPRDSSWTAVLKILRSGVRAREFPLRGAQWLLFDVWYVDAFRMWSGSHGTLVDDDTWRDLTDRCWSASTPEQRRDAAFLLMTLLRWHAGTPGLLASRARTVGGWLEHVDRYSASGLGWLLNDLSHESPHIVHAICEQADPVTIAGSLAGAERSHMAAWGALLDRLAAVAPKGWKQRLVSSLDRPALRELVTAIEFTDLYGFDELWHGLWGLDPILGLEIVAAATPAVVAAINASPLEALDALGHNTFFFLPIFSYTFRRKRELPSHLRDAYGRLADAINPDVIARAIPSGRPRDWRRISDLLRAHKLAAPRAAEAIARRLDLDTLDRVTEGMWAEMPSNLHDLIVALDLFDGHEPARKWLLRHEGELRRPTLDLARIVPEVCARLVREGRPFDLDVSVGSRWERATEGLGRLAAVDAEAARRVVESNCPAIAAGLTNPSGAEYADLPGFLDLIKNLSSGSPRRILESLDPGVAEKRWMALLRGNRDERCAAAHLVRLASSVAGPVGDMAARLRRRFPKSTQQVRGKPVDNGSE